LYTPASELRSIGIKPIGKTICTTADGSPHEFAFGLAEISIMGEVTARRTIFGPDGAEPQLSIAAGISRLRCRSHYRKNKETAGDIAEAD
jgi:hypothetical protein